MPAFDYTCTTCQITYEVVRDVSRADAEAFCPACEHPLRRDASQPRIWRAARFFFHTHGDGPGQHRHW